MTLGSRDSRPTRLAATGFAHFEPAAPAARDGRRKPLATIVFACAVAVATGAALTAALSGIIMPAVHQAVSDWTGLALGEVIGLALVLLTTLVAAICAAFICWQAGRLLTLHRYLRSLHTMLATRLAASAPLLMYGYSECGVPFAADGQALGTRRGSLARALPGGRATLILGDPGTGKTTVLHEAALHLTRTRQLLPIALGHSPLPILVSLPEYALEASAGTGLIAYLARQLSSAGSRELAAQLPHAVRRWHMLLLCDDLDAVPTDVSQMVIEDLTGLLTDRASHSRVAVTCTLDAYTERLAQSSGLRRFNRVVAAGPSPRDLAAILRRAVRGRTSGIRSADALESALNSASLGAQVSHAATLACALSVLAAGEPLPSGRSRVLARFVSLRLEHAVQDPNARMQMAHELGRVAGALRRRRLVVIPVLLGQSPGSALADLLSTESQPAHDAAADLELAAEAGLNSGLLEWVPDRQALRFSFRSVEAALAAHWIKQASKYEDASASALAPEWWEPAIICAAETCDAGEGAGASQPGPEGSTYQTALIAWTGTQRDVPSLAVALALTLEAYAPHISDVAYRDSTARAQVAAAVLRSALDVVTSRAISEQDRTQFTETFVRVERETQIDLSGHLSFIACLSSVDRLVRAQAATLLATLPSPSAAPTVLILLGERDPVMREALDLAMPHASAEVYAAIQAAISEGDDYVRRRAAELLARGGSSAAESASQTLSSHDPRLRAAAARTLGVLQDVSARDALVELLRDPDPGVALAAAQALGRLGDRTALEPLTARLPSADAELRTTIASALADLRDPSATPTLISLLHDADAHVRVTAASALGVIADERSARALRDHRDDDNQLVQAAVTTALRRITRG